MNCLDCGKNGMLLQQGERTFACKTGRSDTEHSPGILFYVTVPNYEWYECPHCRQQFHPGPSVIKMEAYRKKVLDELPRIQG